MSEKQNRKRNRTKMYFLQAARDMIVSQGVESVSVRKVADKAGYAYPTLYNYFRDVNDLLFETKAMMILDMVNLLQKEMQAPVKDVADLKAAFKAYIQYYLNYPNVFKFFYLYPLKKPEQASEDAIAEPDFGFMWQQAFQSFVISGRLAQKDIEAAAKTLIYAIHGMLMLSFSNNGDLSDTNNLYRDLDQIVDFLL